ncbi:MAG: hypothetical protein PVH61_23140 [Candidatus Aminicenantes bacterium]|jgi:hypothetical protein
MKFKKEGDMCRWGERKSQITMFKITNKEPKAVMVCLDSFKLQTMTALIKSFCGGVQKKEDRKIRKMGR